MRAAVALSAVSVVGRQYGVRRCRARLAAFCLGKQQALVGRPAGRAGRANVRAAAEVLFQSVLPNNRVLMPHLVIAHARLARHRERKTNCPKRLFQLGVARIARAFGRPAAFLWRTRPLFGPQSGSSGVFFVFSELALTLFLRLGTYPAPSERFFKNLVAKTRNPKDLTREQPCDSGRNVSAASAPPEKKTVIRPTPHGRCRHWDSSAGA